MGVSHQGECRRPLMGVHLDLQAQRHTGGSRRPPQDLGVLTQSGPDLKAEQLTQLGQGGREWPDARCRGSHVVEVLAVSVWFGEEELVERSPTTEDEFLPKVGIGGDGAYGPREEQVLFNLLAGRPGVGDTPRGDGVVRDHRSGSTMRFTRTFHRRSSVPIRREVGSSLAGVGAPERAL